MGQQRALAFGLVSAVAVGLGGCSERDAESAPHRLSVAPDTELVLTVDDKPWHELDAVALARFGSVRPPKGARSALRLSEILTASGARTWKYVEVRPATGEPRRYGRSLFDDPGTEPLVLVLPDGGLAIAGESDPRARWSVLGTIDVRGSGLQPAVRPHEGPIAVRQRGGSGRGELTLDALAALPAERVERNGKRVDAVPLVAAVEAATGETPAVVTVTGGQGSATLRGDELASAYLFVNRRGSVQLVAGKTEAPGSGTGRGRGGRDGGGVRQINRIEFEPARHRE